mmetsp:Transcript_17752/g.44712  ORF Transcript_17752/g.44712 Transcript_17752/m.44712 type:complete len:214 (-) Transcript_17752:357-998(-)
MERGFCSFHVSLSRCQAGFSPEEGCCFHCRTGGALCCGVGKRFKDAPKEGSCVHRRDGRVLCCGVGERFKDPAQEGFLRRAGRTLCSCVDFREARPNSGAPTQKDLETCIVGSGDGGSLADPPGPTSDSRTPLPKASTLLHVRVLPKSAPHIGGVEARDPGDTRRWSRLDDVLRQAFLQCMLHAVCDDRKHGSQGSAPGVPHLSVSRRFSATS